MNRTANLSKTALDTIDYTVRPLVWYGIAMLALECHLYPGNAWSPGSSRWRFCCGAGGVPAADIRSAHSG